MKKLSAILLAVLVAVLLLAATDCSGYNAASAAYDAGSQTYAAAFVKIEAANARHAVPEATYKAFVVAAGEVGTDSGWVHAALVQWKATGTKPQNYDNLYAALETARQKVRDIAKGVN